MDGETVPSRAFGTLFPLIPLPLPADADRESHMMFITFIIAG